MQSGFHLTVGWLWIGMSTIHLEMLIQWNLEWSFNFFHGCICNRYTQLVTLLSHVDLIHKTATAHRLNATDETMPRIRTEGVKMLAQTILHYATSYQTTPLFLFSHWKILQLGFWYQNIFQQSKNKTWSLSNSVRLWRAKRFPWRRKLPLPLKKSPARFHSPLWRFFTFSKD